MTIFFKLKLNTLPSILVEFNLYEIAYRCNKPNMKKKLLIELNKDDNLIFNKVKQTDRRTN